MSALSIFRNGRIRLGCGFLAFILLIGTLGFTLIEGWTVVQALYTSFLIVSTLGFSDLRPSGPAGQLLTIGLIMAGVGSLYYIVGALAQTVIEEELDRGRRRGMDAQIKRLHNHFIICGYGRVGQETSKMLAQEHIPFVIIDSDASRVQIIQAAGYLHLQGDAADDDVLKHAGITQARALLTAVQSDAGNVYITLSARALNPKLFIVARAATAEAEHKLKIAGASRVISPYVLGGRHMASWALRPAVMDFLDLLMHTDDLGISIDEMRLHADSGLLGCALADTGMGLAAAATILAVRRANGQLLVNPPGDLLLEVGDTLLILGAGEEGR